MSATPIVYLELPAKDIAAAKKFYSDAFGWRWQDWGPDYADTTAGIGAGLNATGEHQPKAPLAVMKVEDLEAARDGVRKAGGRITLDIFSFPGGRRFHFTDPAGNELAVLSEK
ncbi:MAG TPA: VOC family protein [Myxococcales bacterium]|nr:VOC family protein [Myxococcales bacterium]